MIVYEEETRNTQILIYRISYRYQEVNTSPYYELHIYYDKIKFKKNVDSIVNELLDANMLNWLKDKSYVVKTIVINDACYQFRDTGLYTPVSSAYYPKEFKRLMEVFEDDKQRST